MVVGVDQGGRGEAGASAPLAEAAPAWYDAQSGPIFVIVLRAACSGDDLCISATNLAGLPPPEQIRTVGLLQVYVYAHDAFADLPTAKRP